MIHLHQITNNGKQTLNVSAKIILVHSLLPIVKCVIAVLHSPVCAYVRELLNGLLGNYCVRGGSLGRRVKCQGGVVTLCGSKTSL